VNYLAHLVLAPPSDAARVGNLLGDFAAGLDVGTLPRPLQEGVALHRAVDRFTDAHPAFRRSRRRLPPSLRRFSGVLVDVFYAPLLARHWDRFGTPDTPLETFTADCYRALHDWRDDLPPRLQEAAHHMRRLDWLARYRSLAHVDEVLRRMARRSPRFHALGRSGPALRQAYGGLERDFFAFFPQLVSAVPRLPHV